MEFDNTDKNSLIIAFTDAIQEARIATSGRIIIKNKLENKVKRSISEAAFKRLEKVLDDGMLTSFLERFLSRTFIMSGRTIEGRKLTTYNEFSEPLAVARLALAELETHPRPYRLIAAYSEELSELFSHQDVDVKISDRLRLVSGRLIKSTLATDHDNSGWDKYIDRFNRVDGENRIIADDTIYIEYRTSGTVTDSHDTRLGRDFFDDLRSLYGAMICFDIITDFSVYGDIVSPTLIINGLYGEESELVYIGRVEDDIVKATGLATSPITDDLFNESPDELKVKPDDSAENSSNVNKVDADDLFRPIVKLFGCKESFKLKTAASWILRAHLSHRPMDRTLESTIAMEVLLGDRETSDRIGLSKLMANRCAYSLGKSDSERKSIIDLFVRFYKVRSEIVHTGKMKITQAERTLVEQGLDLARQVLRHEVDLN